MSAFDFLITSTNNCFNNITDDRYELAREVMRRANDILEYETEDFRMTTKQRVQLDSVVNKLSNSGIETARIRRNDGTTGRYWVIGYDDEVL